MRRRRFLRGVAATAIAGAVGAHPTPARSSGSVAAPDDSDTNASGAKFEPLASLPIPGACEAVVGPDGSTVFLAVDDGFAAVDVADPAEPRLLAERRGLLADGEGRAMRDVQDVAVDGDRLLVVGPAHSGAGGPKGAILYDVAEPTDPRQLAVHRTDHPIHNGFLAGGRVYLTANDGESDPLAIVEMEPGDGTAGGEPTVLGTWSPLSEDDAWADVPRTLRPIHDVLVHDEIAICSYWDAGTWLVDVGDPADPAVLGRVGERSPAELAAVSDPDGEYTELPGNHHSASIDGSGTLLAVGREAWDEDGDGEGGPAGIDLVDVSTPGSPRVRSTIDPPSTPDPSRRGVWTTAHNFELRGDRLYSAWYQGGVRVHDVSDPAAPREVAAWRDSATTRFWTTQLAAGADGRGADAGAVVASSMGTDGGAAGLYTFPHPGPGEGADPRRVTATPGMAGFGAGASLAGVGVAWLLARRGNR